MLVRDMSCAFMCVVFLNGESTTIIKHEECFFFFLNIIYIYEIKMRKEQDDPLSEFLNQCRYRLKHKSTKSVIKFRNADTFPIIQICDEYKNFVLNIKLMLNLYIFSPVLNPFLV